MTRWLGLALLAACRPAPATVSGSGVAPAAAPLLDAWAQAIGGREHIAALRTIHARGTLTTLGRSGPIESWDTERGEMRGESELDGMTDRVVFDGARGWAVDANGLVIEIDGTTLEETRTAAYLSSNAAFVPGRMAGTVEAVDDHTLRLAPEGSSFPVTVELDPATYLPVRTRRIVDGTEYTTELADYRDVDGVLIAFTTRSQGEDLTTIQTASIDRAPTTFVAPPQRTGDVHFAGPSPIEVALDIDDSAQIDVEVSVDGSRPVKLILDSGAPTLLDPARMLGVTLTQAGALHLSGENGLTDMAHARDVTLGFPGLALGPYTAYTTAMATSYPDIDATLAGIIGTELFQRVVVEIDYSGKLLRLHDPATYAHPPGGIALPFTLSERSPEVEATIELPGGAEATGRFVVDTGCQCAVVVTTPFALAHHILAALPDHTRGGRFDIGTAAGLRLGSLHIASPRIATSATAATSGIFGSQDEAGFIGGELLRRYRVTFDYRTKTVWLDPPGP